MDRLVFLATAALGVAFLVLYGLRCWRRQEQVDIGALVNIMLEAGGVIAGAFLILSTLFPELKSQLATVDLYIFISGLVVLAVSAQRLKRDIWPSTPRIAAAQPSAVLPSVPAPAIQVIEPLTEKA